MLPFNLNELKAGLNLSSKEFILAEIITRFKISKEVANQGLCQLEKLGFVLRSLENDKCSQTNILRLDLRPLIAGFLRKHPIPRLTTRAARLKQLERVLSKPATGLPKLHLNKVADWHKRDRALLSLG
jgi:hypothetical protein